MIHDRLSPDNPIQILKEKITDIAEKCTNVFFCELTDIKIIRRISKLQIYVVKQDKTPMTINLCADINRDFCKLLDVHLPDIREKFNIEVISGGLERPVKTNELHNQIGARVAVSYLNESEEQYYCICFIISADNDELVFIPEHEIIKLLKNKDAIFTLSYYARQQNKKFNKMNHIDRAATVLDIYVNVAKLTNFKHIELFQNKLHPKTVNYAKILKVRLAPCFD